MRKLVHFCRGLLSSILSHHCRHLDCRIVADGSSRRWRPDNRMDHKARDRPIDWRSELTHLPCAGVAPLDSFGLWHCQEWVVWVCRGILLGRRRESFKQCAKLTSLVVSSNDAGDEQYGQRATGTSLHSVKARVRVHALPSRTLSPPRSIAKESGATWGSFTCVSAHTDNWSNLSGQVAFQVGARARLSSQGPV